MRRDVNNFIHIIIWRGLISLLMTALLTTMNNYELATFLLNRDRLHHTETF